MHQIEKIVLNRKFALGLLVITLLNIYVRPGCATPQIPSYPAVESPNGTGISRTITTQSAFNTTNPFFQPLGTNGRSCATCHALSEGANMNPEFAQSLFDLTKGIDPLFAAVDGTNSPTADMSTLEARTQNTSMLRTKGLFRISFKVPANAEFTIDAVDDPYRFANTTEISAFRRSLPSSNLRFLSTVMWDGREALTAGSVPNALRSQVRDAVAGHMQALSPPTEEQITQIVNFETSLLTTQIFDNVAGSLDSGRVHAGPESLLQLPSLTRINRISRSRPQSFGSNRGVFTIFAPWLEPPRGRSPRVSPSQQAIARGEEIFNRKRFLISGVSGFNNQSGTASLRRGVRSREIGVQGACSSCHNLSEVGSNSLPLLMNTGTADGARRTPDLPLYTLRNKLTGQRIQTTDPGAAMTTGKWADIGKFKPPSLRGLETHSPYMHDGFSGDLLDVINFYDKRFSIGLTDSEKEDLKVFLQAL